MQSELFGESLVERVEYPSGQMSPDAESKRTRKPTRANGYAATPGTGAEGETCGSCAHHTRVEYGKTFHKCALVKWTHGVGTDIRVGSPACRMWEAGEGKKVFGI